MAIFTLTDAFILINGVTLSDHGNKVTVEDSRSEVEITAFGATAKQIQKGLGDAKITVVLFQDFAAGKTHQTLKALIGSITGVAVEVRPTSGARSATNPAAVLASALLMVYNFLDSGVAEAPQTTAVFQNNGAGMTYPEA